MLSPPLYFQWHLLKQKLLVQRVIQNGVNKWHGLQVEGLKQPYRSAPKSNRSRLQLINQKVWSKQSLERPCPKASWHVTDCHRKALTFRKCHLVESFGWYDYHGERISQCWESAPKPKRESVSLNLRSHVYHCFPFLIQVGMEHELQSWGSYFEALSLLHEKRWSLLAEFKYRAVREVKAEHHIEETLTKYFELTYLLKMYTTEDMSVEKDAAVIRINQHGRGLL